MSPKINNWITLHFMEFNADGYVIHYLVWKKLNIIETVSDENITYLFKYKYLKVADQQSNLQRKHKYDQDMIFRMNQLMPLYLQPNSNSSTKQAIGDEEYEMFAMHYSSELNTVWDNKKHYFFVTRLSVEDKKYRLYTYECLAAVIVHYKNTEGKFVKRLFYSNCPLEKINPEDDTLLKTPDMYLVDNLMTMCASTDLHVLTYTVNGSGHLDLWAKGRMAAFKLCHRSRPDVSSKDYDDKLQMNELRHIKMTTLKLYYNANDGIPRCHQNRAAVKLLPCGDRKNGDDLEETKKWNLYLGAPNSLEALAQQKNAKTMMLY